MTQSIQNNVVDDSVQNQRLIELIEAEDAANGEVGCGIIAESFLDYLHHRSINQSDEQLRILLRGHLGHILSEPDFNAIANQVHRYIETLLLGKNLNSVNAKNTLEIVKHIPEQELNELLQVELGEYLSSASITQVVEYTHAIVHRTILNPRHTWAQPIWILRGDVKLYIVQAANLEDAMATTREQYPQDTLSLEVIKVGGVLAPNQVITIELEEIKI